MKHDELEDLKAERLVNKIISQRDYYLESSRGRRRKWVDCWKGYVMWADETKNPFLANFYIPKIHEAVELLAAFLIGSNQSITAEAEGRDDTQKAQVVSKYLEYKWRKVLRIRPKLLKWVKQAILFGNGILKTSWDPDARSVSVEPVNLQDVYFNYFYSDIQDSPVIHRVLRSKGDVKTDDRYNRFRRSLVPISESEKEEETTRFDAYDQTVTSGQPEDTVELLEYNSKDRIITIGQTRTGYQILRDIENENKDADGEPFIPFVKVRFKTNPLANRAYDYGAIEPTIKIQLAFNDMMNEIFDNVTLINNKGWIKRRGAGINPMDLVMKPGMIVTVENNVREDIMSMEMSDIKPSALKTLEILDQEFQQASMVSNLLKGIPGANFATEANINQSNTMTMLDMIDDNIKDSLSELGHQILDIELPHLKGTQQVKIMEKEREEFWMEFDPKEIKGKYDIKIVPDRSSLIPKVVKQKQLLDLLTLVKSDPVILQKFPNLTEKIYRRWLEEAGEGDVDFFFDQQQSVTPGTGMTPGAPAMASPNRGTLLTPEAIMDSVMKPTMGEAKV